MLAVVLALNAGTAAAVQDAGEPCPSPEAGAPTDECAAQDPSGELASALPPPDLPTTNEQGYRFALEAALLAGLATVPQQAPIYELVREAPAKADVEALAQRLSLDGAVEERGEGVFAVSGNGQLFVTPDLIQYLSPAPPGDGDLPTDDEAIAAARDWLRLAGLTPGDLGDGRVASRSEQTRRVVVVFGPTEPERVLAAYPSITVSLGTGNTVLEASSRWATIRRADLYQLRDAERAWGEVQAGQAYFETELGESDPPQGATIEGRAVYDRIEIAYTSAGPPGGDQFLLPIFVFSGRLTLDGGDESTPISAYVVALANSGAPVGRVSASS